MKPGDVVVLKSGGQPMTVAGLAPMDATSVECLWHVQGSLQRQTIPAAALKPYRKPRPGGRQEGQKPPAASNGAGKPSEGSAGA